MRRKTFSEGLALLIAFWVLAEILFGFVRDPVADTYRGNVYVVTNKNGVQVVTPLKAKMKLDVVDKGYVYDRRPGVTSDGVRVEFTGGDLDILARYGIPAAMLNTDGSYKPFDEAFCDVKSIDARNNASFFAGYNAGYSGFITSYGLAYHMTFMNMPGEKNCGAGHLGVIDFDIVQFALDKTSPHGFIVATLERDSHISFVQRMIMRLRFDPSEPKATFGHGV